ncbi:Cu-Zn family superoxide dismutase [Sphingomonas antarctica]|uniref:superoxide dismutase family protein n=1 Tax=Sphingomonas antarctica TaxID=2040274 RepID=UPI0039E97CC2
MRYGFLIAGGCLIVAARTLAADPLPSPDGSLKPEQQIAAKMQDATGADKGTATIAVAGGIMRLLVDVRDLPPGPHGIHIHTVGRCDAPGFETAGGHWNPSGRMHGMNNPQGKHAGDFKNLIVGKDGKGSMSADVPGDFTALMDQDGAAIVIHAGADDYKSDPSGNSGARIACGVFAPPAK